MTNERRGPGDYIKEADAEIQGLMEQEWVMESFLSLIREFKRVGDLDVKLESVIRHVTQTLKNPTASKEERRKAKEAMLELRTYVEALENPDRAKKIITKITTQGMQDARSAIREIEPIERITETRSVPGVIKPEYAIHALSSSLEKYLDGYIALAEVKK